MEADARGEEFAGGAAAEAERRVCGQCGARPAPAEPPLRQCPGCKQAFFCNRGCAKLAWPAHRPACNAVAAGPATGERAAAAAEATPRPAPTKCVAALLAAHEAGPGSPAYVAALKAVFAALYASFDVPRPGAADLASELAAAGAAPALVAGLSLGSLSKPDPRGDVAKWAVGALAQVARVSDEAAHGRTLARLGAAGPLAAHLKRSVSEASEWEPITAGLVATLAAGLAAIACSPEDHAALLEAGAAPALFGLLGLGAYLPALPDAQAAAPRALTRLARTMPALLPELLADDRSLLGLVACLESGGVSWPLALMEALASSGDGRAVMRRALGGAGASKLLRLTTGETLSYGQRAIQLLLTMRLEPEPYLPVLTHLVKALADEPAAPDIGIGCIARSIGAVFTAMRADSSCLAPVHLSAPAQVSAMDATEPLLLTQLRRGAAAPEACAGAAEALAALVELRRARCGLPSLGVIASVCGSDLLVKLLKPLTDRKAVKAVDWDAFEREGRTQPHDLAASALRLVASIAAVKSNGPQNLKGVPGMVAAIKSVKAAVTPKPPKDSDGDGKEGKAAAKPAPKAPVAQTPAAKAAAARAAAAKKASAEPEVERTPEEELVVLATAAAAAIAKG